MTYEVVYDSEALLQQITCCSEVKFSGYLALAVSGNQAQTWNLYFLNGWLIGGTNDVHPIRRWHRQIIRYCPQLGLEFPTSPTGSDPLWSYSSLMWQVEQGCLSQRDVSSVVRGNLTEMLFDLLQAHDLANRPSNPSMGDRAAGIRLSYHDFCQKITTSPPVLVKPSHVLMSAMQAWQAWKQAGLEEYSPNLAPVVQDAAALQRQTPAAVYRKLSQLIDGNLTLRDIAIKLKQYPVLLTRSIMPFVAQSIVSLEAVPDSDNPSCSVKTAPSRPAQPRTLGPLIIYVEDSQFDCMAMGKILERTDYRFISICDPIQALPTFLEHKPSLIFLDVLMPMINGYEICAQIRQISALKTTPVIIVTSSDGIVDRVRANLMGASGFLAKPITTEKVLASLKTHLPLPAAPPIYPFPTQDMQRINKTVYPETRAWR
ncbi:MAG: response regulator [Elainellaceae cyanobacterium]